MGLKDISMLSDALQIVSAYIITNRDVLEPDYLTHCEIVRENLIEAICQLARKEANK